ncbi:D-alanyl-D-alanine carboxypeptidase/D-alanyl-D-alanine-endopeptidase [Oceanobacillus sp. 143]|uniref:D-alanyl-D-alanine carboxypeptidase/D-alanyl-D-alanine-endopeptidase n=1 Tax=Oceanobacillus zhaokaii TaxID=2052660 RepID=A0A345PLY0_9BACI|nr:D-alanyl-D-alanine carboxypeptidase/D-alanyl-D-alanine-endopeptidase [Oceanobacillus zhaokaii]AXI11010.1 D-alanyl-D-alanine carboxypeptidase/D-alanyl-D-alanine-endopeptidase [Oceanobacillus zhaokaii]QGS69820.1 D-alanyl-D-alanine carboxypeptidase/D-alanyl-D-alanine-endopeptidase [Oceanobacillus sp. 143]
MVSKNKILYGFLILLILVIAAISFINKDEPPIIKATNEVSEIEEPQTLAEKMAVILLDESLDGASVGISVRKAETGEEIYAHQGDLRLHPASNMKILTAAASLETLGPNYRFATEFVTNGKIKGKVLKGNLYIRGKGDPTLLKADLDQVASELKKQGINQINGNLIGDDQWYDSIRLSQDLNWSDESFYTGAQVSALTLSPNADYDAGTVIVEVIPGTKHGEQAQVALTPKTNYVTIVNKTEMVSANEAKDLSIEREHGTNNIIVEGKIPVNGTNSREWIAVWEPTEYVLNIFKQSLEQQGIKFAGNSEVQTGVAPENATVLTSVKSIPLNELLLPFMKLSNNGIGETLTKELGQVSRGEGSWDKGLEVIGETAAALGVNPDTVQFRDGSGMSHKTLIPASELTKLLYQVQQKEWFADFELSLPVAGMQERLVGGTLRHRMKEGPAKGNVIAKTGSLTGVSSLAGYVTTSDGEKLIFSIVANNFLSNSVTSIEDAIATMLATHEFE